MITGDCTPLSGALTGYLRRVAGEKSLLMLLLLDPRRRKSRIRLGNPLWLCGRQPTHPSPSPPPPPLSKHVICVAEGVRVCVVP